MCSMMVKGISRIGRGIHRISNLLQARAVILLYHRIADLHPDPQLLCVTPEHFTQQMEYLRQHYQPISLQVLRQALVSGDLPRKAVVITFDDGYADNLWNARPILERYDIPATVFVTSGYVECSREFPSEELERYLLQARSLPEALKLVIAGKIYSWQIGDLKENIEECYHQLHSLLRPLNQASRQVVLEDIANWASCPINARPQRRALNAGELKMLSEDGLVEIGAHGISHLVLSAQPVEVQWREISESKRFLEDILGRAVTSFSYPYGGSKDVSEETIGLVQEAGFTLACANFAAPVIRRSELFWLPRYLVRDWNREEFAKRLRGAF